ncbi:hypothetical protein GGF38_003204, partial [Coemansia sp. RSA 25]
EFVTVVGRVGSGKSSFLSAICGEMPLTSGQGCVYGRIGYVEQKPWIMNATFRDNVLMGADFDQTCFWQVVEACALAVDVQLFPKSDMTMIGTDGVNLSGGQKVRLALARALYLRADTYVFDDLLSAVDAHVERHIVEHVLSASGIIGQKTRILVTHAEHLVPLSDAVITFTDGNLSIVRQTPLAYNAVPSETADSKESTPNSDSGTTEQQVGAADMYEKPPEYRRISSMWSAIWHFVKFSEYGTVAIVMATQVTQTYALYYTQSLRTELMTDGNPASMAQSLKHYLVVNALAEIGSHQVRKFEKWIQETVWTASLMAKMRSQIVDLVLSMPLSVLESLPDSAMEDLFYQCRWTLAKNMPEFLCHSVLFGILSALSATAQVIKTSPGLILLCGPLVALNYTLTRWYGDTSARLRILFQEEVVCPQNRLKTLFACNRPLLRVHGIVDVHLEKAYRLHFLYFSYTLRSRAVRESLDLATSLCAEFVKTAVLVLKLGQRHYASTPVLPGELDALTNLALGSFRQASAVAAQKGLNGGYIDDLSRYLAHIKGYQREQPRIVADNRPAHSWPEAGEIEFR